MINPNSKEEKAVKQLFDEILNTKVEMITDGKYTKANLFSSYTLTDNSTAEIVLSSQLVDRLMIQGGHYTILRLDEYLNIKRKYSKELYRLLRQFRHSGTLIIKKEDLIRSLKPPKSYSEYNIIRKAIIPAIEDNKQYFEDLKMYNLEETDELPDVCKFTFKKHSKNNINKMLKGKSAEEAELLKYIMENGGSN